MLSITTYASIRIAWSPAEVWDYVTTPATWVGRIPWSKRFGVTSTAWHRLVRGGQKPSGSAGRSWNSSGPPRPSIRVGRSGSGESRRTRPWPLTPPTEGRTSASPIPLPFSRTAITSRVRSHGGRAALGHSLDCRSCRLAHRRCRPRRVVPSSSGGQRPLRLAGTGTSSLESSATELRSSPSSTKPIPERAVSSAVSPSARPFGARGSSANAPCIVYASCLVFRT